MLEERKRKNEEHIADLIAASFCDELYDLKNAQNINCYAAARGLIYPDTYRQYYSPGVIHRLKFGTGPIVINEWDPAFIDKCIELDNIALNQPCVRVNFNEIDELDGNYYFAITDFHTLPNGNDHHWHFIFRTPSGLWLHKPNWIESLQLINWQEYGNTFKFCTTSFLPDTLVPDVLISCEGICFPDYFYKMELPE